MWSTKEKHKWQGAHFLQGPYTDSREKLDKRFKGKQFTTLTPKVGNPGMKDVLFSRIENDNPKKFSEPYDVGNSYLKSHPPESRKLGFGSHDAPKKGEFMSQQRAAQVSFDVLNYLLISWFSTSIQSPKPKLSIRLYLLSKGPLKNRSVAYKSVSKGLTRLMKALTWKLDFRMIMLAESRLDYMTLAELQLARLPCF